VEENTIRWTVGELKKSLRKCFADYPGELVEAVKGGGYALQVR
jgi:hypothetical protein